MRLFIAVALPEQVKDAIEKAQEELRGALAERSVRWTKRGQLHLTLKFLGDVDPERLDALTHAVGRACEGFGGLQLRAGRIGGFPDLRRPRVVWTRVHDERERLPALQRVVEAAAAGFTAEKPEGAFTGHVTLGRCRTIERSQAEILAKLAGGMENRSFGQWTADRIEIIRSEMAPEGSRYTTVAEIPLAPVTVN